MKKSVSVRVIRNGKVYLERGVFCQAVLIEGSRVAAVGTNDEVTAAAPAGAELIDAAGSLVLPAFYDSHFHLQWMGRREGMIACEGARSIADVIERGRALIEKMKIPPGSYVQGAGANPDFFADENDRRDLTRDDLDKISTVHPVIISRHCGHTIFCNSMALQMAGMADSAPDISGGTIEKDARGRPTGVCRENANAFIRKPQPAPTRAEIEQNFSHAMRKCFSLGITTAGSYDVNGPDFDEVKAALESLCAGAADGRPPLRLSMQCGISGKEKHLDEWISRSLRSGTVFCGGDETGPLLKFGCLKLFADGTLGGRTAWMRKPYRDKSETSGFPVLEQATLEALVRKADAAGIQVAIHAIGDAGVDAALRAFEKVIGLGPNTNRHGVIHCQITTVDILERMARSGILALVQPIFLADDMYVLESRVGSELASTSYAWGTMERLGVPVCYSTDAPVSPVDPLLGISWAVRRQNPADNFPVGGYFPAERVSVTTAIDAYTTGAACSAFDEGRLGRIKPGYLADIVFIDRDLFSIPPEEIHQARVMRTLLGGETVYNAC